MTARQIANYLPLALGEPGRHELRELIAGRIQYSEGGETGAHHLACGIHDLLQNGVERVLRRDRQGRVQEPLEAAANASTFASRRRRATAGVLGH
ncbi:MAG TPA: hypothetical protein VEO73_11335 [Gemmatimonadales bacterium]|nr:hypothetical protein [Gemmatimonadales bacterium]